MIVGDRDYDPNDAANRAAAIREQKYEEVKALLLEQNELHCAPHSTLVEFLFEFLLACMSCCWLP